MDTVFAIAVVGAWIAISVVGLKRAYGARGRLPREPKPEGGELVYRKNRIGGWGRAPPPPPRLRHSVEDQVLRNQLPVHSLVEDSSVSQLDAPIDVTDAIRQLVRRIRADDCRLALRVGRSQ
jgi:hypothetical protein